MSVETNNPEASSNPVISGILFSIRYLVPLESMDLDDLDPETRECAIAPNYLVIVDETTSLDSATEQALDYFHNHIGISCLDDFEITTEAADPTSSDVCNYHTLDASTGNFRPEPEIASHP